MVSGVGTEQKLNPSHDDPILFSAIVVTYNEISHLSECLKSLAFCEETLVVDLGSTDGSPEFATSLGARVIPHEHVPVVEQIREEIVTYARNDWVILLDPDEVLPPGIEKHLRMAVAQDPLLGMISLPWQFYFCGRPLHSTIWGTANSKGVIRHRQRNTFSPHVHRGIQLKDGFSAAHLTVSPDCAIKHYWVDSLSQMFAKHYRYIRREGEARYKTGERFRWTRLARDTKNALWQNLFTYRGLRGGLTGVFLSMFYAWYIMMSLLALRRYERSLNRSRNT